MILADIFIATALLAAPLPVAPVDAEDAPIACLSAEETREAVAGGHVMQPVLASRRALDAVPGEVVRISLCRQGEDFVYVVTTLKRDGKVARVTLDGHSGKVSAVR